MTKADVAKSVMGTRIGITVPFAVNSLNRQFASAQQSIQRLSSGNRVVRAADDIANIAHVARFRSQVQAWEVAVQNTNAMVSVLQRADQTLADVAERIQRIRTLLLQSANGTTSDDVRQTLKDAVFSQLMEIDRVARGMRVGSNFLMAPEGEDPDAHKPDINFVDTIDATILNSQGYNDLKDQLPDIVWGAIQKTYGALGILPPADTQMTITLQATLDGGDGEGNVLATGGGSTAPTMSLTIDLDDFLNTNGGAATVSRDPSSGASFTPEMIIVHEMVHAVTATSGVGPGVGGDASWGNHVLANWVSGEGAVRVAAAPVATQAEMADGIYDWTNSPTDYTQNALIGQFISKDLGAEKFEAIMNHVRDIGAGATLWQEAVVGAASSRYAGTADFEAAVQAYASEYINRGLYNQMEKVGLGWMSNYQGGTAGTVIETNYSPTADRIYTFDIPYATVGAFNYLALVNPSTTELAQYSLETVDQTDEIISYQRGQIGAQMDMLLQAAKAMENERTNLASALSQLADVDMATELTDYTKQSLLVQSSNAFIAQAQDLDRSIVLGLLA